MRKRLGILILIIFLAFIIPTKDINGQGGTSGNELLGLVILAPILIPLGLYLDHKITSCSYPWHPGDYYYDKNYKIIKPINKERQHCFINCRNTMNKTLALGSMIKNSGEQDGNFMECYIPCRTEAMKPFPTTVAYCAKKESDGYYSDGSYYESNKSSYGLQFEDFIKSRLTNTHELKETYERTEWQEARDYCMDFVSKLENATFQIIYRSYNDCLKERGY